jgi:hypothetical protein
VPLHLITSPTQKKIKNNTTYTYYNIYQLKAFFIYLFIFQFKKERLICSSILGLFPFWVYCIIHKSWVPIMYQKVLHLQLFTHKSLSQKKKKNEKQRIFEANTIFFSPVWLASYIYNTYALSLQLYLQNLRLELVKFCVWKNSLCICIFSSIFTSMHVDLASLCVARAKHSSIYSSAW